MEIPAHRRAMKRKKCIKVDWKRQRKLVDFRERDDKADNGNVLQ